jgi:hypothetical protein
MKMTPSNFWEWMSGLSPGDRMGLLFFGLMALVAIIAILGGFIYRVHKNRLEDALKRELLERGMTAEEIVAVINSSTGKGSK